MFWINSFIEKRRKEWLDSLIGFQVLIDGVWVDAMITDKRIEGNALKITTLAPDSDKSTKITGVRFIDKDGDVAGQRSEYIVKTITQGLLTLWEFPIYELE